MPRTLPRFPTAVKVAAILAMVAASAPAVCAGSFVVLAGLTGVAVVLLPAFGMAALLLSLSAVGLLAGWRVLKGRVRQLNLLRRSVEYASLACGVFSVPGTIALAIEIWGKRSPTAEAAILCGTVSYCAVCSVTGMLAAVVWSAHIEDYDRWREATFPTAEEVGFEFVDE